MRARLLEAGPDALNDQDLLEMVLYLALPRRDTKPIVRMLLTTFGNFAGVVAAPRTELVTIEGCGEAGAAALKTVQAAALRLLRGKVMRAPILGNWDRLIEYLVALLAHERVEHFRVLFLDSRNRLMADETQSQGTINRAAVFPREVARRALELHATAVILVHNHPSGDPAPSGDDVAMTRSVRAAVEALGITLHDHLLVGANRVVSFRQEGLLQA
jgi:DNA repair protein RadC